MRRLLPLLALLLPLLLLCAAALPAAAQDAPAAASSTISPVRHIVIFKYRPGATQAQIDEVSTAFAALKDKIPGIIAFEMGVNNSPENKNLGFTHVYQLGLDPVSWTVS